MPDANKPQYQQDSAGFLANHMSRLFTRALAETLQPLNLAIAQFMVLLELWEEDGLTQRHLIQKLDVEHGTMNSTLNRVERDRLIVRRPHPTGVRAQTIHVTPQATTLRTDAIAAACSINATANAALSSKEQKTMIGMMTRVIAALGHPGWLELTRASQGCPPSPVTRRGRSSDDCLDDTCPQDGAALTRLERQRCDLETKLIFGKHPAV